MTTGGDAAEQVVRLSLEGVEVALRITGKGAAHVAILLAAALREEHKTKGKARLTNLIRSGRELKVFSLQNKDLQKFSAEAKRYGVLYCALKDRENKSDYATVDIIARADDAAKIQRIMDRFDFTVTRDNTITGAAKEHVPEKSREDAILDEVLSVPKEEKEASNPFSARTEKSPLFEQRYEREKSAEGTVRRQNKPSVKKKLQGDAEKNSKKESIAGKTLPTKQRNTGKER